MANTLFALDVHDDLVTGVMVEHTAKTYVITACGMAQVGSRQLADVLSDIVGQVGYKRGACRVALGAEKFFFRNLEFPFSDRKKIVKILPGELAEYSLLEAEETVFDFLLAKKIGGGEVDILAAFAERQYLDEQLETLKNLSLDPEFLGISGTCGATGICRPEGGRERYLYLDVGLSRAVLVLVLEGQITLVRSLVFDPGLQAGFQIAADQHSVYALRPENAAKVYVSFSRSVKQTVLASKTGLEGRYLPIYLAGPLSASSELADVLRDELGVDVHVSDLLSLPFVEIKDEVASIWHSAIMDRALALALSNSKNSQMFNFRKGGLKRRVSFNEYSRYGRIAMLPLALCVLLVIFAVWRDNAALKNQQVALEKQIHDIFTQTLPEVTRIVDPVQQLEVRIKEAKQAYMNSGSEDTAGLATLTLLADISERIPISLQVRIVRMVADQNDVRLKGTTENFNIVDSIQKELGKSPFYSKVEISSANLSAKSGEVDFELKLDLRR